jgi:hypothetical protein
MVHLVFSGQQATIAAHTELPNYDPDGHQGIIA